eukprot:c16402_g1_i2 orf=2-232(-)
MAEVDFCAPDGALTNSGVKARPFLPTQPLVDNAGDSLTSSLMQTSLFHVEGMNHVIHPLSDCYSAIVGDVDHTVGFS